MSLTKSPKFEKTQGGVATRSRKVGARYVAYFQGNGRHPGDHVDQNEVDLKRSNLQREETCLIVRKCTDS